MTVSKKDLLLFYIKQYKIKDNKILAKLLDTTPKAISVMKVRLINEGLLTKEEANKRVKKHKKKPKKSVIDELF